MPILYSNILGVEGKKELVILHGLFGMSDNWKTLGLRFVNAGFRVHLIDSRNHGRSFHDKAFSYAVMTEDLKYYLTNQKLESVSIVGHSMGGKTAMNFAVTYPQMVEKLVVVDIGTKYYPIHHREIINALLSLNLENITQRMVADEGLTSKIKDVSTRQFLLKSLYRDSNGKFSFRFNLKVISEKIDAVGEALANGKVYTGKTLFIRGGNSNYIEEDDEDQLASHFPNYELVTIAKAGHWVHAENPQQFFKKGVRFLKKL